VQQSVQGMRPSQNPCGRNSTMLAFPANALKELAVS
jgi:hypothetical protein